MATQYIIRYYGRVQGVGFRYTTCRIATGYNITGYVKNMPDGSVECIVEGNSKELNLFISEINSQMSGHIIKSQMSTTPATNRFRDFSVRY